MQLAWFGGLSGVIARTLVKNSKAIAQGYEDQFFKTYFIAHNSTNILASQSSSKSLPTSIAGKSFTFGSKGSTSGRLIPEYHIRNVFNKAPSEVFSKIGFSGNHTKTIELVQAGAYELGAVNFKVWQKELAAGNINESKVKIIWTTPTYPDYQWSIRGDIDTEFGHGFTAKVTAALLNMHDKNLLAAFPRTSFVKTTNDFYQPIKSAAKSIGLID